MAGHSKWANIKHRKARSDAKRGKIFTKLIREIVVSARLGGADVGTNPRLRTAVEKALRQNMTREIIQRAAQRGAGGEEGAHLETMLYEGYGPGGLAVLVRCLSDNRNRTVSDVRHAFVKYGGSLGAPGSVSYLFEKKGTILVENRSCTEEQVLEAGLDWGLEELLFSETEGCFVLGCAPEALLPLRAALEGASLSVLESEVVLSPLQKLVLTGSAAQSGQLLLEALEDLDDVQTLSHNGAFSLALAEQ